MAALPYMQFYVADYLADTAHLTAAQHGAYLLLLMNYWQRGKALKNDNVRLANVARMSNEEWKSVQPVLEEFFTITDESWVHERIERDLAAVNAKSVKCGAAGKASARSRNNNKIQEIKKPSNERSTNVERTLNHTDTDTDTEQNITEDTNVSSVVHGASADGPGGKNPDELIYAEYPRKEGHRAAIKQIQLAVVRLKRGEGDKPAMEQREARRFLFAQTWKYARSPAGKNPDRTKIPMPKTWYGQSRYLDDPEQWKAVALDTSARTVLPPEPGINRDAQAGGFTAAEIEKFRERRARGEPIADWMVNVIADADRDAEK